MKAERDSLRAIRAAWLLAGLAWGVSIIGCSGSGGQCLNPQPLPPFCLEPQPLPPPMTNGTSASGSLADGGAIDTDASAASTLDAGGCQWPDSLNEGGPGACAVARAYLACTYPSGAGCLCLSDDPTSCAECGPSTGAVCKSMCSSNEYAVSCGGPPQLLDDGGGVFDYQSVPATCTVVAGTPGGNVYACCPCP